MDKDLREFTVKFNIIIEYNGTKILDHKVATVLKAIKEKGSILSAAKTLGIPFSYVYDTIAKIERLTGKKVVDSRRGGRGGGGTVLTEFGEKLISIYEIALVKLKENGLSSTLYQLTKDPELVVAHSHDPLLSLILSKLSEDGFGVQSVCTGSGKALAMLSLELADVACIHLYDPETKTYNRTYLEKLWLINDIEYLGGYYREIVFVYRPSLQIHNLSELLRGILNGELVIASRNKGSGTRVLLESILTTYAKKMGMDLSRVRGLGREIENHDDVAKNILQGRADVGLTLRYIAEKYGLKYIHVTWELYECYALKIRINKGIARLRELMSYDALTKFIDGLPGYRAKL
ncbi:MAG: substrate-binding domain-containing protein [Ignisphaera sp.]